MANELLNHDECMLCFRIFPDNTVRNYGVKHHITYFPPHIIWVCDSCHAVLHFSKDPIFDLLKQYKKGDRILLQKTKTEFYKKKRILRDPRHVETDNYRGYF